MPTIINNPGNNSEDSSGAGIIIGVVVALVLVVLFFVYILPTLRDGNEPNTTNIDIELPATQNNEPTQ